MTDLLDMLDDILGPDEWPWDIDTPKPATTRGGHMDRHADPLFHRNRRIVRKRTDAAHRRGESVACIGCGRQLHPGEPYQVGHRIDSARGGSHDLDNLGPQHRRENLSRGGKLGASIQNQRSRLARGLPNW